VPSHLIRTGALDSNHYEKLGKAIPELEPLPIFIDDSTDLGVSDIHARAQSLQNRYKIKFIIIDYLQIMRLPKGESQNVKLGEITRALKNLARKLGVPVLLLSQLNREVDKRNPPVPRLVDLRDSGSIEQDADNVLLLLRPSYYDMRDKNGLLFDKGMTEVIIAKQRNGPTGSVAIDFDEETIRFGDWIESREAV
jgi:replicative DNA helicase